MGNVASASQSLNAGGVWGCVGVQLPASRDCTGQIQLLSVQQSWGGRVEWMEVCTGGAFTLTPLQRCAAPGLLPEGLSPCAGGCSVSVLLHQVTSWEK